MIQKSKLGVLSIVAVAMLLMVAFVPVLASEDSNAANATATINIQPGQKWNWTPTFTAGLSPTVTVSASDSSMPSDTATFGTTSGYASISSGKITVSIPSDYSKSNYYVKVKAVTTKPTQTAIYEITFNVAAYSMSYNISTVNAKVGTAITELTPTITGGVTANSYAISSSLPSGLSFDSTTGKITGTPTAYKAQASYTITATLKTTPVQTVTATVSIGAYTNITASNYTVYAIKGTTAITVPGVSMPTGTVLETMTLTATKDSSVASVTAGTAYNGMTVEANTGKITGTPSVSGTYVFTEIYKATAATGGSSATRTITVVVEDMVSISGDSSFHSYEAHEDSITLTKSTGPTNVTWSIAGIKKGGTSITSGTDFTSFSISNGKLTSSTATTPGTYVITVKLATSNTTTNTSGATGATVTSNSITKDITVYVAEAIEITNDREIKFYETENPSVYDALTLTSNIDDATFSVKSYGDGITASNVNVSSTGEITPGTALTKGTYTIAVEVKDPNNETNTTTETVTIVVEPVLTYTNTPSIGLMGE